MGVASVLNGDDHSNMTAEAWVARFVGVATIAAIVVGPIAALRIQRQLDDDRVRRDRKQWTSIHSLQQSDTYGPGSSRLGTIDVEFTDPLENVSAMPGKRRKTIFRLGQANSEQ